MTGRTGYEIREGSAMIRDRIIAATGPCVGLCRERHADAIVAEVERARAARDLSEDLKAEAAARTGQVATRRLRVNGG